MIENVLAVAGLCIGLIFSVTSFGGKATRAANSLPAMTSGAARESAHLQLRAANAADGISPDAVLAKAAEAVGSVAPIDSSGGG